jgi:hypothetical protein
VVLGDASDIEAELVGDNEQLLRVAISSGQVAAALDVRQEAKPEPRPAGDFGHADAFRWWRGDQLLTPPGLRTCLGTG